MLVLSEHDVAIVATVRAAIRAAIQNAEKPPGVAKKICVEAMKHRNRGRAAAMRRHPFRGKCEASGMAIERHDAALDELEPEKGYEGKVRWVCHKANNSGRKSCGKC